MQNPFQSWGSDCEKSFPAYRLQEIQDARRLVEISVVDSHNEFGDKKLYFKRNSRAQFAPRAQNTSKIP